LASAKAGLKFDTQQIKAVISDMKVLQNIVEGVGRGLANWMMPKGGGKATSGGYMAVPNNAPGSLQPGGNAAGSSANGAMGMFSKGGGGTPGMFAANAAMQVASQAMGALDSRIERGANYALTADRYNVVMQQQYGLSQNQVMNQMRKPLANYRMGPDGINAMMGFQQKTGYQATPQMANSLAGIRAITGYSKTGQDVVNDQMSLMDPNVANRMLYMTGANAYSFNGGLNDPMKMRQQIVQSMGLTNASVLKGAKGPGSVTRARMADAGISSEMQDEILTYANANLTFKQKGGKGMYDPSKKDDRKKMGIEENYATQAEETDRLRQVRDENFSRRQLDNLATNEKYNQEMVKLLEKIESGISALVGARVSNGGWMKGLGNVAKMVGAATAFINPAVGIGIMGVGSVLSGSGDPVSADKSASPMTAGGAGTKTESTGGDGNIMVPYGYNNKKVPLSQLKSTPQFSNLNSKLQDRLLNMFRANPGKVGIGGGGRSENEQRTMFMQRYRKTSAKTDVFWEGSYWEHVSGAAAAPPGQSMHEIGLAADLVGDMDWIKANAGRFGLRSFYDVNNEPWHVQPSELPGSRYHYEKAGAPWGLGGGTPMSPEDIRHPVNPAFNADALEGSAAGPKVGYSGISDYTNMSISQIVRAVDNDAGNRLGSGGPTFTQETSKKPGDSSIGDTPIAGVTSPNTGGALAGVDVARAAYAAGFRGDDLVKMIAISKRESGWKPRAYNGDETTGDHSYGLWQLNTLNSKKGGMMGDLVNSILGKPQGNTNFDDLFDPNVNAKVAYAFYQRNGNTTRPWGGYKGVSDTAGADQYLTAARQAVSAAHLGDPTGERRMSSSAGAGPISVSPTYQITVAPNITFIGSAQSNDLKKIAQEVTALIEQNVRTLELRGA
jgi:hypothetical protein